MKEKESVQRYASVEMSQSLALPRRLCLHQSRYEEIEVGGIDVTDGEDAQVMRHRMMNGKTRLSSRQHRDSRTTGSLGKKDRNLVLMDGEKEQRCRLSVQVREIAALESRIYGKNVWQVEAERQLALEPWLYGVAVCRYNFG